MPRVLVLIIFMLTSIYHIVHTASNPHDSTTTHGKSNTPVSDSPMCRDRMGYFRPDDFRISTCTMCFVYLFPTFPHFRQLVINGTAILLMTSSDEVAVMPAAKSFHPVPIMDHSKSASTRKEGLGDGAKATMRSDRSLERNEENSAHQDTSHRIVILRPDVRRKDSMEYICHALTPSQCHRWRQCCQAASQCCDRQIKLSSTIQTHKSHHSYPKTPTHDDHNQLLTSKSRLSPDTDNGSIFHGDVMNRTDDDTDVIDDVKTKTSSCPITWDGYSCVQETAAGKTAHVTCPSFISLYTLSSSASATRRCMSNATWWISPVSHLEWTDYSQCLPVDFESMRVAQILAIACNCVSIVCVIPSLLVFLLIRPLRRQPRIQLHISLFVAMLLSAIFGLLWERLVMYDMLVTPLLHNFVHSHPKVCRFLNMAARLSDTCTFFWMFCQGFHLQWLMVRSFKPFHALGVFSLIGWGIPALLIITYIIVRYHHFDDDACWIQSAGVFEWVIDGPTMACIVVNLVFLAIILKALWSQLEAHPDHIGPVRRTVRALFLLIPLFGLQQFCIVYRPHVTDTNYVIYDVISAIIVNSQGALVAIIFCFMNEEVRTQVKHHAGRWFVKVKVPQLSRQQGESASAPHVPMAAVHHRPSISSVLPTE